MGTYLEIYVADEFDDGNLEQIFHEIEQVMDADFVQPWTPEGEFCMTVSKKEEEEEDE